MPPKEAAMKRIYVVELTGDERQELRTLVHRGSERARRINRAQILLHADEGKQDKEIATALHTGERTVQRVRRRFVEDGLNGALNEATRIGGTRMLTGEQEAYVVALACSTPPDGRREWTMQLLADRVVALGMVEAISDETIRRTLKRGASNRGSTSIGVSPR
jgi:transposase